jgi:hypothetical protein
VTSHIPDKGQVMVRYHGLCKALYKPWYITNVVKLGDSSVGAGIRPAAAKRRPSSSRSANIRWLGERCCWGP